MADGGQISATGRRSQFRWPMSGAGGEGLQRIVSQVSNGSSAELNTNDPPTLGEMDGMIEDNKSASFDDDAPQPESEPVKPNETTVEEGFPDLEMAQMDPSQMDETDQCALFRYSRRVSAGTSSQPSANGQWRHRPRDNVRQGRT